MATVERVFSPFETPPVLHELRSLIKRYVALEGSALVLDYWFEPSAGVRQALLLLAVAAVAAATVWFVVLRLVRDFRTRALALVLERRFPELNDRLITAVELSE